MSSPAVDRQPLSRERILRAGIELADEHGIAGLSMRKLAAHLGFEVMSLYNHVANKDDLVEGMLDVIHAGIEPPPVDAGWKAGLRAYAISMQATLRRHRWAATLVPRHFPGDHRWRAAETILGLLSEGGFTGHLRDVGYHAITVHIGGFTQQQLSFSMTPERAAAQYERFRCEVSADDFPLMVDHVRYHTEMDQVPGERPDEFQFVLDLILDGLERSRADGM